jgi:hypothetical protein
MSSESRQRVGYASGFNLFAPVGNGNQNSLCGTISRRHSQGTAVRSGTESSWLKGLRTCSVPSRQNECDECCTATTRKVKANHAMISSQRQGKRFGQSAQQKDREIHCRRKKRSESGVTGLRADALLVSLSFLTPRGNESTKIILHRKQRNYVRK